MTRTDGERRVVLITGATSGIGLEAAKVLAGSGHHVVLHARNAEKAARAEEEVRKAGPEAAVESVVADLSSSDETEALARDITARLPRLDALVLNAGLYNRRRRETPEGIEETFMVNHLSQFLLVKRLDGLIKANPGMHIVIVASQAHRSAQLDIDDLEMKTRKYSGWLQYSNTKLMNLLLARALAHRLKPHEVRVNAMHPGVVNTGIVRKDWRAKPIFKLFGLPPERAAESLVHLIDGEVARRYTGHYFVDQEPKPPRRDARSDELAETLWRISERYLETSPPTATTGDQPQS